MLDLAHREDTLIAVGLHLGRVQGLAEQDAQHLGPLRADTLDVESPASLHLQRREHPRGC